MHNVCVQNERRNIDFEIHKSMEVVCTVVYRLTVLKVNCFCLCFQENITFYLTYIK